MLTMIYSAGFKVASLCVPTEHQTLAKIFCRGTHLFRRQSVPFPTQGTLQRLQTFVGLCAGPGLQNGPDAVVHRIEIWRVGRPFSRRDEVRKMGPAPLLSSFRLVRRCGVLLKCPTCIAEVLLSPRKYGGLENVATVHFLVDFDPFLHENEGGLAAGANSAPNHHGRGILAVFDDRRRAGGLRGPAPVVLVIMGLFDGEELLIREENFVPLKRSVPTKKSLASFKSYALVVVGEELNFLELERLEMEILFGYSTN